MDKKHKSRFEKRPRATLAVLLGCLALLLAGGGFFLAKAVRDEVNRGVKRTIPMRENRPQSDLAHYPNEQLFKTYDGLEYRRYRLRADADGFVEPSKIHEKPDLTVVFLGGSTTECHYMDELDRYPYLVGRRLEERLGLKVNSYNGGFAGNNTMHMLMLLLAKVLPLNPQVVVFMECVNDVNFLINLGDYWKTHASRGLVADEEYGPVKTYIIRHLMGRQGPPPQGEDEFAADRGKLRFIDQEKACESFHRNLETLAFVCRVNGATPVFMTQFNRLTETPDPNIAASMQKMLDAFHVSYADYRSVYRAMNQEIRDTAAELDVPLVDLENLVPQDKAYMYDAVHLNADGSHFVADIVTARLEETLKAPARKGDASAGRGRAARLFHS